MKYKNPRRVMEQLEDRILFDAVPDADFVLEAVSDEPMVAQVEQASDTESQEQCRELVIVDRNVENSDALIADILDSRPDKSIEVRLLDSDSPGMEQISEILGQANGEYEAVHIVSHGSDGNLQLGSTVVNLGALDGYAADLAGWSDSLTAEADVLFYGCGLAETSEGMAFIEAISEMTGADVAASDDTTGARALGGDWDLEKTVGDVTTSVAFSRGMIDSYQSTFELLHNQGDPKTTSGDTGQGENSSATFALANETDTHVADMRGTISETSTTASWGVGNAGMAPEFTNEDSGKTRVVWEFFEAGTEVERATTTDLKIGLDGDRGSMVYVNKADIAGYSLADASNIEVTDNGDGTLLFKGTSSGNSLNDSVVLHLENSTSIELLYANQESGAAVFTHEMDAEASSLGMARVQDSDGDGVFDQQDIDDDNDGIIDVNETQVGETALSVWQDATGDAVRANGNQLDFGYSAADAGGWNSSISSASFGEMGYEDEFQLSFEADQSPVGYVMVGLNEAGTDSNNSYTDIDKAIYLANNRVYVYENGQYQGYFGNFEAGDKFNVQVDGTNVNYQKNGTTFFSSSTEAGRDYFVDTSFYNYSGSPTFSLSGFEVTNLDGSAASATDKDSDRVQNHLDLDSDNDGISDLQESGNGNAIALDRNRDGMLDASEAADSDGDGLMDVFEGGNLSLNAGTLAVDSDADGIVDAMDLDSDGDGISDNVEAQATMGFVGAGMEVDERGVTLEGLHAPVDSDADGTADYLDVDSDNDQILDSAESGLSLAGEDENEDGIDDAAANTQSTLVGFQTSDLANEVGDQMEVGFRELSDVDGDGVADSIDIDDDNDGILDVDETQVGSSSVNWVNQFGSGVHISGDQLKFGYSATDATNWNSNSVNSDAVSTMGYKDSFRFNFSADQSPVGYMMIGLNEAGSNSTASYTDIDNAIYLSGNRIYVYENGSYQGYFGTFNAGDEFGIEVDGTTINYMRDGEAFYSSSTSLGKDYFIDSSFYNYSGSATYSLSNISVTNLDGSVASSSDQDSDGIQNHLDRDSDNDGVSDLRESGDLAGISLDKNQDGSLDLTEAVDSDGDGLMDVFEDGNLAANVGTTAVDTDGDGITDAMDLDSDADGISDNIEAQTTAGYTAPTGAVDQNGVDQAGLHSPVDTDGDGLADYVDRDSDNDGTLDVNESGFSLSGNDADENGIDDGTGVTYTDQNGFADLPSAVLANEIGDNSEVGFRELSDVDSDGVADALDIDDDNDGILDVNETKVGTSTLNWISKAGQGVVASGDQLKFGYSATDSSNWNSNSVTSDSVSSMGYEGSFRFNFTADQSPVGYMMIGLNEAGTSSTASYTDIDNAIYLSGNRIYVYENGAYKNYFGTFNAGDEFSIEVDGTRLNYQRNGESFYSTSTAAGKDYCVDSSFYNYSGSATYTLSNMSITNLDGSVATAADQDSDGVENHMDRDSDNDGISDLRESGNAAGVALDLNNDGTLDLSEAVDSDGDGLMDVFEDGNLDANMGTEVVDSDGDGIADVMDLDSDSDGISDNIEAQATAGYTAPTGVMDENGVDQTGLFTPVDTDGDGAADYLDRDSDNDEKLDVDESGLALSGNDSNKDGIDDATNVSYADQNGFVDMPSAMLANESGDNSEVGYRELYNDDVVSGTEGNDVIDASYLGDTDEDVVDGADGNDDIIDAGAGHDQVFAGVGNDTITLGTGEDVVVFEMGAGDDRIMDFVLHEDKLDVSALMSSYGNPVAVGDVVVQDDGFGNAKLVFSDSASVVLEGYSVSEVDRDFLLDAGVPDDNLAVVANDDVVNAEVGQIMMIDVTLNDFDPEEERISVVSVDGVALSAGDVITLSSGATLTMRADGSMMLDASVATAGTQDIAVEVADEKGKVSTSTLTLNVAEAENRMVVVASNDQFYVTTDDRVSEGTVLSNDVDDDGDYLSVTEVEGQSIDNGQITLASGATITMNENGTFDYDQRGVFDGLAPGETTTDEFTYTVKDSDGTSQATVTMNIKAVLPTFPENGATYQVHSSQGQVATVDTLNNTLVAAQYSAGVSLNAVGLNTNDMYAYGMNQTNKTLAQIGSNGQYIDLGPVEGMPMPNKGAYVGDFGGDGLLYVRPSSDISKLYGIDVTTAKVTNVIELSSSLNKVYDITWNSENELFYTVRRGSGSTGDLLLSIDTDGNINTVGDTGIGPNTFGAMFSDANGSVYGISNATGYVYQFDTTTGEATHVATASSSRTNDGFSNPDQVIELAPFAANDRFEVDAQATLTGSVMDDNGNGEDVDGNGDVIIVTSVDGVDANVGETIQLESGALVKVNADGTFDYDPNGAFDHLDEGQSAIDSFTYVIADEGGLTSEAEVQIHVAGSGLVAEDDSFETASVATINGDLHLDNGNGNDFAPGDAEFKIRTMDGSEIEFGTPTEIESGAIVTIYEDGTFIYDPNGQFDQLGSGDTALDSFTYTIEDEFGRRDTATATVTVYGVCFKETNSLVVQGMSQFGVADEDQNVVNVGDVNGNGFDDFMVAAPEANQGAGLTFLIYGTENGLDETFDVTSLFSANGGDGSLGTVFHGIDINDWSGAALSAAGDVNNDGVADFMIGATNADGEGGRNVGETYVVFGKVAGFDAEVRLGSLLAENGGDGSSGFVLKGISENDHSGAALTSVGDMNGDGIDDIAIGAMHADVDGKQNAGQAYVVYGQESFDAEFDLKELLETAGGEGNLGFAINGMNAHDLTGRNLQAGDVNNDGLADLILTSDNAEANGLVDAGQSYVVYGKEGMGSEFDLSSLLESNGNDGSLGVVFNGSSAKSSDGSTVRMIRDVDGDGLNDFVASVQNADGTYECRLILNSANLGPEVELVDTRGGTVSVDNFDTAEEGDRDWDQYVYSTTLHSTEGTQVTIWGDPHVVTVVDGVQTKYDIGYGAGKIELSDGTTITWDTYEKDPNVFNGEPPLKYFAIDSPGDEYDIQIDLTDGANFTDAKTALTESQLREFAAELSLYAGDRAKPLTKGG